MKKISLGCLAFAVSLISLNATAQTTVTIDVNKEYQTITGFGGHYPNNQVDMLVNDMGMSVHRCEILPDFEATNDNSDPLVANSGKFDFEKGTRTPVSQLVALKNAGVKYFMATPWSPPGWMKDNNSATNGGSVKESMYPELVEYFVEFCKQFESNVGIPLHVISIQNEPRFEQTFKSCVYTPKIMHDVIALLGKRFEDEGIKTKIMAAEDMGSYATNTPWFQEILINDNVTAKYTGVWAVHGYSDGVNASGSASGWEGMYNTVSNYDIPLWMTETSGYAVNSWEEGYVNVGSESGNKPGAFDLATHIYWALKYGKISAWVWWRINIGSGQTSYWLDECLSYDGTKTTGYYASKQFYKYVRPEAVHVESSCSDTEIGTLTFKNPEDGSLTFIFLNFANSTKTIQLDAGSTTLPSSFDVYRSSSSENCKNIGTTTPSNISLPARSISTLVYSSPNHSPTLDKVDDIALLHDAGQQTINLTGISDGDGGGQTLSVSAISLNTNIVDNVSLNYSSGSTATLNFTPKNGSRGKTQIAITLSDNGNATGGLNTRIFLIDVDVLPFINQAPTVNGVEDFTIYLDDGQGFIELPGLSDGNDGSQEITATAESAEMVILDVAAIISGDKIKLLYEPYYKATVPVTLTLQDDGGIYMGGSDKTVYNFNITTLAGTNPNPNPEPTGINSTASKLIVYPNPAANLVNISLPSTNIKTISIFSITGTLVKEVAINNSKCSIDISNLETGFYLISCKDQFNSYQKSFVKE